MAEVVVRTARAGDGLAIATVQLEVWQTAFAAALPVHILTVPPADLAASWTSTFGHAHQSVVVAVEGAQVVGFSHAVVSDADPAVGDILVLHVRPAWARRGHGGRLLAAQAAALRDRGAESGAWWIPESDPATQRFAALAGWTATGGTRVLDTGRSMLTERRWSGPLDLRLR